MNRLLKYLCLILILSAGITVHSQDLDNPLILENEWPGYAIGDPYVIKHNGLFYLYCSTKNFQTGIKCWSSRDLVNWTYEGMCSTAPVTYGAYAPEVFYWNGMFYMYTSPEGKGHYVLSSTSPTGPFGVITSNFGKSIDGSVFIDDDANWYFYHASSEGIKGCSMSSPTSFGTSVNLNAWMNNGWTEGPCVFKRNEKYYLIYTGNHVISKGYRIDYAVNNTGPIDHYTPADNQNPILVDAMGYQAGLGHGSIFIGPDLDSYYLTYHNLVSAVGPFRRLNFDRIAWNGVKMILLGPTDFVQQNPEMPDVYDFFDRSTLGDKWTIPSGGIWSIENSKYLLQDTVITGGDNWFKALLDSVTLEDYTAEFNVKEFSRDNNDAKSGAVFAYTDEENYGIAVINGFTKKLEINFLKDNNWETAQYYDLPEDFDYSAWHTIRIEHFNELYRFFVDGLLKCSLADDSGPGRIGYLSSQNHAGFGYIAFSNKVNGSGTFNVFKPLPGKLPAVQYNRGGEGVGYHKKVPSGWTENILRTDEVEIVESSLGGYALASLGTSDWFDYNVNVKQDKKYNVEIIYATDQDDCKLRILADGSDMSGTVDLPSTGGINKWGSYLVKDLSLTVGYHSIRIEIISGGLHLYSMEIVIADNSSFNKVINFDGSFGSGWNYADGSWLIQDNRAFIDGFGKRTYGSDAWCDYTVETEIMFTRNMNAGLIFRVNNPALGGAGDDPAQGTDFLQGYFAGFNYGSIVLGKHNYGWESLATASGSFIRYEWYHMRAVLEGNRIRIYIDDMANPMIDYIDTIPFINGMAGLRSFNTGVRFDNFRITSDLITSSDREILKQVQDDMIKIHPNPSSGNTVIDLGTSIDSKVRIIDMRGVTLFTYNTVQDRIVLPANLLPPGVYFVSVEEKNRILTKRLILQ